MTIFVFSLAQFTNYDDDNGHAGHIELFQGKDNSLGLITIGNDPGAIYICFAKCDHIKLKKNYLVDVLKSQLKRKELMEI